MTCLSQRLNRATYSVFLNWQELDLLLEILFQTLKKDINQTGFRTITSFLLILPQILNLIILLTWRKEKKLSTDSEFLKMKTRMKFGTKS